MTPCLLVSLSHLPLPLILRHVLLIPPKSIRLIVNPPLPEFARQKSPELHRILIPLRPHRVHRDPVDELHRHFLPILELCINYSVGVVEDGLCGIYGVGHELGVAAGDWTLLAGAEAAVGGAEGEALSGYEAWDEEVEQEVERICVGWGLRRGGGGEGGLDLDTEGVNN